MKICVVSAAFVGLLGSVSAHAMDLDNVVSATLLSGWRMENGRHMAALEVQLAPGWKTYWRTPGDAGIPPQFDWSGSENVASVAVHWPAPEMFDQNGFTSVGYDVELVMPLEITPSGPGEIRLGGGVQIGVCQDICIPVWLDLTAELPSEGAVGAETIQAALARRPMTAREAGVGAVTCDVVPTSDGMRVTMRMELPQIANNEDSVFEFADPEVWISEAQTVREGHELVAVAELVPAEAAPFSLARKDLRFTVLGGGQAVEVSGCTAPG